MTALHCLWIKCTISISVNSSIKLVFSILSVIIKLYPALHISIWALAIINNDTDQTLFTCIERWKNIIYKFIRWFNMRTSFHLSSLFPRANKTSNKFLSLTSAQVLTCKTIWKHLIMSEKDARSELIVCVVVKLSVVNIKRDSSR